MRTIAHISDLHFGTEDPEIAEALLGELDVSLVVVSGDLTQRAREAQFAAARDWLARIDVPILVVPGNHDVPLFDVVRRFADPYGRYRRYITDDLDPVYVDDELAVSGINTAHSFTIKSGRISREQAEAAAARLRGAGNRWRIVVAHHPFVIPHGVDDRPVDGAEVALPILRAADVDLVLTGHLHVAYEGDVAGFRSDDRTLVSINAGTCMSTRRRGEPNGYNRLVIAGDMLTIVHREWADDGFRDRAEKTYHRGAATLQKCESSSSIEHSVR